MDKKIFFGFLFATAMVGCTNEEFTEKQQTDNFGLNRPVIENFSFAVEAPETRMEGNGSTTWFNGEDEIGAVLVDYQSQTPYTVVGGHVGNNKFKYNETKGKFETDGTTVVGSWLFYASYDERMTKNRNGVKFDFPAVQKYSGTGYEEIAKIDFKTSPIVNLAGQEDGYFNYEIPMTSVYSYARITMKFDEPVVVQKLVIRPTAANLQTSAPFSTVYTIKNTSVPVANVYSPGQKTEQEVLNEAMNEMRNRTTYSDAVTGTNFKDYLTANDTKRDIIALDCLENTTESIDFDARMAIPAGKYNNLAVYAYTNKGVYKYDVKNANVGGGNNYNSGDQEEFLLRRQYGVALHKINGTGVTAQKEYLGMEASAKVDYTTLATANETNGTVVIGQKDLVAVINGIDKQSDVKIRVLGDAVEIDQEVMTALSAKVEELGSNLQVVFEDAINIKGNETENKSLVLHNITFNGGATLKSGYAEVEENVNIPDTKNLTVNSGTTLTFKEAASSANSYAYSALKNNGTVNIEATDATSVVTIGTIENNGALNIKTKLTNAGNVTNAQGATITNESEWSIAGTGNFENNGGIVNEKAGVISLEEASENNGTITNSGEVNVKAIFDNNATITNNKKAVIVVNGGSESALNNAVGGKIYNYGDLYCHEGKNTINNVGRIEVMDDNATTYITTNSKADESTTATNDDAQVMGEIVLKNAKDDVSVTTTNRKGYISWNVPTTVTSIATESGYKFNKVYLTVDTKIEASAPVQYIEATGIMLTLEKDIQELEFSEDATIYATRKQIAQLSVKENCRVKVPTDNEVGVYDVEKAGISKTEAKIINKGTILVGGNFWSKLTLPNEGTFASGDGNTTAFHWGKSTAWTD